MLPADVGGLTDWQVTTLYLEPFMGFVAKLTGGRDVPDVDIPDDLPPDLVERVGGHYGVTGRAAEAHAAQVLAALADLKRIQKEERERVTSTSP